MQPHANGTHETHHHERHSHPAEPTPNGVAGSFTSPSTKKYLLRGGQLAASGIFVALAWFATHILNSPWFNAPVNTAQLQTVKNDENRDIMLVRSAIDALTHKGEVHDRILERLVEASNQTRTDVAEVKGYLGALAQTQALAIATPAGRIAAPQPSWRTKVSN
jgi:hypothetical protein